MRLNDAPSTQSPPHLAAHCPERSDGYVKPRFRFKVPRDCPDMARDLFLAAAWWRGQEEKGWESHVMVWVRNDLSNHCGSIARDNECVGQHGNTAEHRSGAEECCGGDKRAALAVADR